MGLNNLGHVLVLATDSAGSCPRILWIWDGNGGSADHFTELTPVAGDATTCPAKFVIRFDGQHLNDQDHVALEFGAPSPVCANPQPLTAGILAGGTYTPLIDLVPAGVAPVATGIGGINNHDQLLAWSGDVNIPDLLFWDGASVRDLGLERGAASPNDLGHVLLLHAFSFFNTVLQLHKNGATSDVPVPAQIPGFTLAPGTPQPLGITRPGSCWCR
jgi:hypothetical protein